jgi:hypothetical protein
MKKLTLLLLLIVSTNVLAEWTSVGSNDNGNITFYIDYGTLKKKGNKMKIWTLINYKIVQKLESYSYLSSLSHEEYDCEEETVRTLDSYRYSEEMKQGDIVLSSTNIKEEPFSIIPESVYDFKFKIACSKK